MTALCKLCRGPLIALGKLGNLSCFRCRNCGIEQSKARKDRDY